MACATFLCLPELLNFLLSFLELSFYIDETFVLNYATGTVHDEIPMQVSCYESP